MSITTQETTSKPLSKEARHQARFDELEMNASEELYERLLTITGQFVHFNVEHAKIGFTLDPSTFAPYMATQAHYEEIGMIGKRTLIVYKTAHSREVGYGLLRKGKKLRCLKIDLTTMVELVMKRKSHGRRKTYLASLLLDLDELIARTQ